MTRAAYLNAVPSPGTVSESSVIVPREGPPAKIWYNRTKLAPIAQHASVKLIISDCGSSERAFLIAEMSNAVGFALSSSLIRLRTDPGTLSGAFMARRAGKAVSATGREPTGESEANRSVIFYEAAEDERVWPSHHEGSRRCEEA